MTQQQTCPRRMNEIGPWQRQEGMDEWRSGRAGVIGQERVGLSCSFCGSLHPDRFMELVREGWVVGPTDKIYKAYLGQPRTAEEIATRKQQWLAGEHGIAAAIRQVGAKDGKSAEQITADLEDHWTRDELPMVESGCGQEAKFYYAHLSPDQMRDFVDLYNGKAMRIGYPGHFYRLPFFMVAAGP